MESSPETLQKIWVNWNERSNNYTGYHLSEFRHISRRTALACRFEDWLFSHGIVVKQRDGVRFLKFTDPDQAVIFLLEWC